MESNKSLQQLENCDWGEPSYDSYLVTTCHKLRRVPLNMLTIEDLRILIGQSISLPILVPLAVHLLKENPLAEGDFYPGDLLVALLRSDRDFWARNSHIHKEVCQIVQKIQLDDEIAEAYQKFLYENN